MLASTCITFTLHSEKNPALDVYFSLQKVDKHHFNKVVDEDTNNNAIIHILARRIAYVISDMM